MRVDDILKGKMRVKISWQGVEEKGRDEILVQKKLRGLGKFLRVFEGKVDELGVVVRRRYKRGYRVNLFLDLPGKGMKTNGEGESVERAVIEAREKMERKIKKYVGKLREGKRRREVR